MPNFCQKIFIICNLIEAPIHLKSLTSEATSSTNQFFKRSYNISHPRWLKVSQDALPSFAALSQSAKIGLSKWIFYFKIHPNLWIFFSLENKNLAAHFLLKLFICNYNFITSFLLKSGPIFDEAAELGKATQDPYNLGGWLIL